jgi:GlcNAc-P-P-Und epimerase
MRISRLLITGGSGFIGTNAVQFALDHGIPVCNLDIRPPRNPDHTPVWYAADLLDFPALCAAVAEFRPTHVLHLGARTDLRETRDPAGYAVNTRGVRNLAEALAGARDCARVVYASSMLVCRNGYRPRGPADYCPDTLYGASKAEGEEIVRSAGSPFEWCLVRPTSIWGPWFREPYRNFFDAIGHGVYRHPGAMDVVKALGYVGNTVWQLYSLLDAQAATIQGGVFYLADYELLAIRQWADWIAAALGAPRIGAAPLPLFRAVALLGDVAQALGVRNAPLTSFRLRNMLTPSSFDLSPIEAISGPLPYTARQGVRATVEWLSESSSRGRSYCRPDPRTTQTSPSES